MNSNQTCKYCAAPEDKISAPCLHCCTCQKLVHISCLKRKATPGGIHGDVFFIYTCSECSPMGEEIFQRDKMPWFQTITLVLFELYRKSEGSGKKGFFHWKIHVSTYIDKHWHILFRKDFKRKKKWIGTVSGTLSIYSPHFFLSGTDVLKEGGWWRPTFPYLSPEVIVNLSTELTQIKHRQKHQLKNKQTTVIESDAQILETLLHKYNFKITTPENEFPKQLSLMKILPEQDIIAEADSWKSTSNLNLEQAYQNNASFETGHTLPTKRRKTSQMRVDEFAFLNDSFQDASSSYSNNDFVTDSLDDWISEPDLFGENLDLGFRGFDSIDFSSSENLDNEGSGSSLSSFDIESFNSNEDKIFETIIPKPPAIIVPKSLFANEDIKTDKNPWESEVHHFSVLDESESDNILPITQYEESIVMHNLGKCKDLPKSFQRILTKLRLRKLKRERNLPPFNIDNVYESLITNKHPKEIISMNRHLDRYNSNAIFLAKVNTIRSTDHRILFSSRLVGCHEPQEFVSPYTNRLLKPFIRRDYETKPLWLKLMNELQCTVQKKSGVENFHPKNAPIDYCYVRLEHIPAINSLCELFFWPGIDMTEALQHPDFTCVVLYKKIVIGFAFMIPDVQCHESYISFIFTRPEWRRAKIATFMLYHLVQTCMGKDVTLHVSATNAAVILYQKFGFKVEEFIQDFYEKYMDTSSRECKHALFLRLAR